MKNRILSLDNRRRRRGTARLFVLGAAFAASGAVASRAAVATAAPLPQTQSPAASSTEARRFAIRPAPLGVVIAEFRQLTGMTIVFADPALTMIQSPGVDGTLTPQQALDRLLMGTSVAYAMANGVGTLDVRTVAEFVTVMGEAPALASPKYTEPLRDTPQTITVIPRAVLQEQGATTLRDTLRNTPGITLAAGEGGIAPGDNILIRGFSARNDVYIDGARDPGVLGRDTFNTESVEVAKGPSSVTAGRGATGGSVNLVTKAAALHDAAEVRLTAGSADQKRATLDLNRRLGQSVAFRVNGMWQDAGVPGRDSVEQKAWGFAPSVGFGIGRPTSVTLSYQHLSQDNVPDSGLPSTLPDAAVAAGRTIDAVDFSNFYGLLGRDRERIDSDGATATVEHHGAAVSVRNLTRYGRNSLDRVVTSPRAATAANALTDPGYDPSLAQIRRTDAKYQFRNDRTLTNQTDLSGSFRTGAVDHRVVTGVEIARDRQPSHAATDAFTNGRPPVTSLFDPKPADFYAPAIVPTGATSVAGALSMAVYGFDTVKLDEHWQVALGARWDRVDVDYTTVAPTTGAVSEFGRVDRVLSGRGGIVYKPVAKATVYASYGTSFTPSFDGGFGLTLAATGANSAALPPERTYNIEAGTKWDVTPRLFVTGAVFKTEKTNAKTTDGSGVTILAGDQQVSGVELSVSGDVMPRWNVFSGLSLLHGEVEESGVAAEVGKRLAYVPRASFNFWSTYRLPFGLTVGGGAQFTDGYFFTNTNALATPNQVSIQRLTKYWLFNSIATYQLNERLSLQVNATNLADTRYVERANQGHFLPGPARAVVVTPVFRF